MDSQNQASTATPPPATTLFRTRGAVKVGELNRFVVKYTPRLDPHYSDAMEESLWLRVRNVENVALRAAYLNGPYILYVDVRPEGYDHNRKVFSSAEQPVYEPQLKAGQSMTTRLYMNRADVQTYVWTVDVVSQIVFSPNAEVQFELSLGRTREALHGGSGGSRELGGALDYLRVERYETLDIWNSPQPRKDAPLHLVVLTHGLHSNVGADMLYVKERIDEAAKRSGENIIVRGYTGNTTKTEKGIKFLGRRLANYITTELVPIENPPPGFVMPKKISFVAHSLGGLVQTYAIAEIQSRYPDFFDRVKPVNFICMATPFLGISYENPAYIKFALDVGFAGKTGRDLGMTWRVSAKYQHKPLLQILPSGPTHTALRKFDRRTLYANSVNDGIVPLRTSALLYLDWKGISKAMSAKHGAYPAGSESAEQRRSLDGRRASQTKPTRRDSEKDAGKDNKETDTESGDKNKIKFKDQDDEGDMSVHRVREAEEQDTDQQTQEKQAADAQNDDAGDDKSGVSMIPEDEGENLRYRESQEYHGGHEGSYATRKKGEFLDNITGSVNAFFSFFAPQSAQKKPGKIYQRSQTVVEDASESEDEDTAKKHRHRLPKKTSLMESGVSVLIPPAPSTKFINDPDSRPHAIFHDRVYRNSDLPPRQFKSRSTSFKDALKLGKANNSKSTIASDPTTAKTDENDPQKVEKSKVEERIAREWHRNMDWRKVLVRLDPDAHNNIVVRRRFVNAYGWPVIDHLIDNHFAGPAAPPRSDRSETKASSEQDTTAVPTSPDLHRKDGDISLQRFDPARDIPQTPVSGHPDGSQSESWSSGSFYDKKTVDWDTHLKSEGDSSDEGIVPSVNGLIDNFRDLSALNFIAPEQQPTTEPLDTDTIEERVHLAKI